MDYEIGGFRMSAFSGAIAYGDPMLGDISLAMSPGDITSSINAFLMEEKQIDKLVKEKYRDRVQEPDSFGSGQGKALYLHRTDQSMLVPDNMRHSQMPTMNKFNFGRRVTGSKR